MPGRIPMAHNQWIAHSAGQNEPRHVVRFVARPSGEVGLMNCILICVGSVVFAAAMTCAEQGPLAAPTVEKQVSGLVPQKQFVGSPAVVQMAEFAA